VRLTRLLLLLAVLLAPSVPLSAPGRASGEAVEAASLRTISAWLHSSGRDGYLSADVADAAGIPRAAAEDLLEARQRGFRSGEVLRIVQASADGTRDFLVFMVQRPDGEVYFYFATVKEGLKKAFVSIPKQAAVLTLERAEAQASFQREILYWQARVAGS
jgi:hypothetical protein